jgi:hypothetical protein
MDRFLKRDEIIPVVQWRGRYVACVRVRMKPRCDTGCCAMTEYREIGECVIFFNILANEGHQDLHALRVIIFHCHLSIDSLSRKQNAPSWSERNSKFGCGCAEATTSVLVRFPDHVIGLQNTKREPLVTEAVNSGLVVTRRGNNGLNHKTNRLVTSCRE